MIQFFRLVGPHVDRVIAFDELPERLLVGIRHRECDGLPRQWFEKGCNKKTIHIERQAPLRTEDKTIYFHYLLEYIRVNADKEKWEEITNFVRKTVDTKVRLMDKMEQMALLMAPSFKDAITLEPEDVLEKALIPIPFEFQEKIVPITEAVSPIAATETANPVIVSITEIANPVTPAIVLANESGTVTQVIGKATHTCKTKAYAGRYSPKGECLRCDQLREIHDKKQLVTA